MRTHLDLFSGIGGFALAAERVWPAIEHTFCEIDPFCQAVLRKHWPHAEYFHDIKTLTSDTYRERLERGAGRPSAKRKRGAKTLNDSHGRIDLLTGGFPCQPFSAAGRRGGTEDDRHLWPEMLRVIQEFNPRWVIGENVGGFLTWNAGMVFEQVLSDLESAGYSTQAFIVPAAGIGAPHRRDRVWIIAHADGGRRREGGTESAGLGRSTTASSADHTRAGTDAGRERRQQEPASAHGDEGAHERRGAQNDHELASGSKGAYTDTGRQHERRAQQRGDAARASEQFSGHTKAWDEPWTAAAARLCTVDDGLPAGVVRPRGWRNAALKAAGNAIVPQVAESIMRAIQSADSYPQPIE